MDPEYNQALALALKKLKASDKLESELCQALETYGFSPQTVTAVLSFLKDRKLVNDRRTIENHIERRAGRRSFGIEKIRAELLQRGAPEEIVEDCLASSAKMDELDGALEALRARFRNGADRAKAGRFLMGRGFAEELVEQALDRFFESNDRA